MCLLFLVGRIVRRVGIAFIQCQILPAFLRARRLTDTLRKIQQETPKKPFVIKGLAAEGCFQRSLFGNIFPLCE